MPSGVPTIDTLVMRPHLYLLILCTLAHAAGAVLYNDVYATFDTVLPKNAWATMKGFEGDHAMVGEDGALYGVNAGVVDRYAWDPKSRDVVQTRTLASRVVASAVAVTNANVAYTADATGVIEVRDARAFHVKLPMRLEGDTSRAVVFDGADDVIVKLRATRAFLWVWLARRAVAIPLADDGSFRTGYSTIAVMPKTSDGPACTTPPPPPPSGNEASNSTATMTAIEDDAADAPACRAVHELAAFDATNTHAVLITEDGGAYMFQVTLGNRTTPAGDVANATDVFTAGAEYPAVQYARRGGFIQGAKRHCDGRSWDCLPIKIQMGVVNKRQWMVTLLGNIEIGSYEVAPVEETEEEEEGVDSAPVGGDEPVLSKRHRFVRKDSAPFLVGVRNAVVRDFVWRGGLSMWVAISHDRERGHRPEDPRIIVEKTDTPFCGTLARVGYRADWASTNPAVRGTSYTLWQLWPAHAPGSPHEAAGSSIQLTVTPREDVFWLVNRTLSAVGTMRPPASKSEEFSTTVYFAAVGTLAVVLIIAILFVRYRRNRQIREEVRRVIAEERERERRVAMEGEQIELLDCPYGNDFGEPPSKFVCPIAQQLMYHPVTCVDGHHTFERAYLLRALLVRPECPLSRDRMSKDDIRYNHELDLKIVQWVHRFQRHNPETNVVIPEEKMKLLDDSGLRGVSPAPTAATASPAPSPTHAARNLHTEPFASSRTSSPVPSPKGSPKGKPHSSVGGACCCCDPTPPSASPPGSPKGIKRAATPPASPRSHPLDAAEKC